jgi:hypothetical protein
MIKNLQGRFREVMHNNYTYKNIPEKYLRQSSIDFDFCNLTSSCDVVYKGRWWYWHDKLVTDLFYDFVSILLA